MTKIEIKNLSILFGDVGGIVDAPDAAGEAPQTEDKRQQHGYSLFHPVTS